MGFFSFGLNFVLLVLASVLFLILRAQKRKIRQLLNLSRIRRFKQRAQKRSLMTLEKIFFPIGFVADENFRGNPNFKDAFEEFKISGKKDWLTRVSHYEIFFRRKKNLIFMIPIDIAGELGAKDELEAIKKAFPGTLSWVSESGRYLDMNDNLIQALGVKKGDLEGLTVGEWDRRFGFEFKRFVLDFFKSPNVQIRKEIRFEKDQRAKRLLLIGQKFFNGKKAILMGVDQSKEEWLMAFLKKKHKNFFRKMNSEWVGVSESSRLEFDSMTIRAIEAMVLASKESPGEVKQSFRHRGKLIEVRVQSLPVDGFFETFLEWEEVFENSQTAA